MPPPDQLPDDHALTVAATVALSVEAADRARPPGLASRLLRLAAVLDPEDIPIAMFTSGAVCAGVGASADAVRSALLGLHRRSLVSTRAGVGTVRVHALVQRAVRDASDPTELRRVTRAAAMGLLESWPDPGPDRWLSGMSGASAIALYRTAGDDLLTAETGGLPLRAAASLGESGQAQAAMAEHDRLWPDYTRVLGPNDELTLACRNNLARWTGVAGDPARAAALSADLVADCQRVFGLDHPRTLTARSNLAYWRGAAGHPARP